MTFRFKVDFPRDYGGPMTLTPDEADEARRMEAELRESERRFESAFQYAPIGMAIVSPTGTFLRVNRALAAMVGYTVDELTKKTFQDITHPEDLAKDLSQVQHLLVGEADTYSMDKRYFHADDRIVWVHLSVSIVRDENKKPLYFVSQIQDITAVRLHLTELERAKHEAEQASRAKSEFLANMSHEIRTPMNAILGMTELLLNTQVHPNEQGTYLQAMLSSGQSLLALLNDVIDLSRIEARKLQLMAEEFSIPELVERLKGLFSLSMAQKELSLLIVVDDDVPRSVFGDHYRIQQVLVNLIGNAHKFTPPGGSIAVRASLLGKTENGADVTFSVRDTGIGIPAELIEQIFDAFQQVNTSHARLYSGAGLGLTISQNLVALLGGVMKVESRVGEGSCFTFTVPLPVVASGPAVVLEQKPALIAGRQGRVLVAEDNRINQLLLRSILAHAGHEVVLVENGVAALERVESEEFDLMLLDIQMPILDGYETARRIREQEETSGKHLPIIALTAHALSEHREQCMQSGMDDYLTKPVNRQELLKLVLRFLA